MVTFSGASHVSRAHRCSCMSLDLSDLATWLQTWPVIRIDCIYHPILVKEIVMLQVSIIWTKSVRLTQRKHFLMFSTTFRLNISSLKLLTLSARDLLTLLLIDWCISPKMIWHVSWIEWLLIQCLITAMLEVYRRIVLVWWFRLLWPVRGLIILTLIMILMRLRLFMLLKCAHWTLILRYSLNGWLHVEIDLILSHLPLQ